MLNRKFTDSEKRQMILLASKVNTNLEKLKMCKYPDEGHEYYENISLLLKQYKQRIFGGR